MAEQTSKVRYEPCGAWSPGPDPTAGSCAECGWFEEDHWLAELERRPVPAPAARPVAVPV
ncbi:MAG TPA: hypothetical protein VI854_07770 [Acidimicrobiia bacterium]|nr:hypothetical protein [Acidimicrobiia bacterium]